MKKTAFTLIELIFVIVLIGVLSGIGFYMNRPDVTRSDAQYTLLKLKEARYRAIGYDDYNLSGCVTLTDAALENDDTSTIHDIKSEVTPDSTVLTNSDKTVCFDSLGRPHDGNSTALSSVLRKNLDIVFTKGDKNTTIRLFPQSGYAIINCKN